MVPAVWALRRWQISDAAALCLAGFVLLHLFAARWSYSSVPYEGWFAAIGLDSFNAAFGFTRNMFDRLVHFLFGLLIMVPAVELARRAGRLGPRQALAFALLLVLAIGGLYEIFEWSLTMLLAPEDAGAYNGEQGDMFDSQKDMAVAALGALLAAPWAWRHARTGDWQP
jgi:putative membrane protein